MYIEGGSMIFFFPKRVWTLIQFQHFSPIPRALGHLTDLSPNERNQSHISIIGFLDKAVYCIGRIAVLARPRRREFSSPRAAYDRGGSRSGPRRVVGSQLRECSRPRYHSQRETTGSVRLQPARCYFGNGLHAERFHPSSRKRDPWFTHLPKSARIRRADKKCGRPTSVSS